MLLWLFLLCYVTRALLLTRGHNQKLIELLKVGLSLQCFVNNFENTEIKKHKNILKYKIKCSDICILPESSNLSSSDGRSSFCLFVSRSDSFHFIIADLTWPIIQQCSASLVDQYGLVASAIII